MRNIFLPIFLSASFLSGAAYASVPTEVEDIRTGTDLAAACNMLVDHDPTDEGKLAAKACSDFLGVMVQKVYVATPAGEQTMFSRVGPKQDTNLCFRLPDKLSFVNFAKLVLSYGKAHPELDDRPAFETGAWVLSTNFPCPEVAEPD